ncbi:hypothetical protein A2U01_0110394, partial [Trifolium medium]|nr:hypothetical protein [Trifolium medium]
GVGATRRQSFRKLDWFWPWRNARPWMAQRAVLRAGVALATIVCAARRKARATRERDAYL